MRTSRANQALWLVAVGLLIGDSAWPGTIQGRIYRPGTALDLSDFVISVEDIRGPFPAPGKTAVIDQKELRFVRHVLAIQAGTTLEFPNSDPVGHNVFSISEVKHFNLGLYGRGAKRSLKLDQSGVVELLCNVHLGMSAFIVVLENPYFAQTGPDGTYRISGVPAGVHLLRCWHKRFPAQERLVRVTETGTVTVDFSFGK